MVCEHPNEEEVKRKRKARKKKNKGRKDDDDSGLEQDQDPTHQAEINGEDRDLAFPEMSDQPYDVAPEDWMDVTDMCRTAASAMHLGEMIESPSFRLLDAMSAIEIMDPKMDSGFNNSFEMTLERAHAEGILASTIPYEELIGIWDQLFMYFMLWLEGHTIVQTCFCCMYLQDLQSVKPIPLFGAFVDAMLLAIRSARESILRANVFDDEDFLPNMFNFDLSASVFSGDQKDIVERIKKERDSLAKNISPLAAELSIRLELICQYAVALEEMQEPTATVDATNGATSKADKATGLRMESAMTRLTGCLQLIEKIVVSAQPPPPNALRAFDASTIRRLLVPGPPRLVEPLSDPQVVWKTWVSHIGELVRCGTLTGKPLILVLEGSPSKDEPNVLPRSMAQLCISNSLIRKCMVDSLESYLFPIEALQHCKKHAGQFLDHCEPLFLQLVKLANENRARRFRRLARVFSEFDALQSEAWRLDEDLKNVFGPNLRHPRPCWIWVMDFSLQAMLNKLFLGFELDLYDDPDYHMIYWYADYLYGLRIYNLSEIHHAKEQAAESLSGYGQGKRRTKPLPTAVHKKGQRPKNPPPVLLLLQAIQHAVRGLFRLHAFCLRRGLVSTTAATVEGMAQRFVLRFRALEHFRLPHLPSFADFQQSVSSAEAQANSRVVLDAAQMSFTEAGQMLDKYNAAFANQKHLVNVQEGITADSGTALRRVLVANLLAITQIGKALDAEKRVKLTSATSHHPFLLSVRAQVLDQPSA